MPKKRRKVLPVEQLRQVRPPTLPGGAAAPLAASGAASGPPAPPGAQNRRMNAIKLNPAPKIGELTEKSTSSAPRWALKGSLNPISETI